MKSRYAAAGEGDVRTITSLCRFSSPQSALVSTEGKRGESVLALFASEQISMYFCTNIQLPYYLIATTSHSCTETFSGLTYALQPMSLADLCIESFANLMSSGNRQLSRRNECAQATSMLYQREVSMLSQPKAVCLNSSTEMSDYYDLRCFLSPS